MIDLSASANAGDVGIAEVSTGARVHSSDKHKIGRIDDFAVGARDRDLSIF